MEIIRVNGSALMDLPLAQVYIGRSLVIVEIQLCQDRAVHKGRKRYGNIIRVAQMNRKVVDSHFG